MSTIGSAVKDSFEEFSKRIGFVSSIEVWARKHGLNVYVAVHEHKEIKESIISEIKLKNGLSILDIGAGYGFLVSRLNEMCPDSEVVGTDISRYQMLNARKRRVCGSLVVSCAGNMPLKDSLFDFVVCSEVIEHVTSPRDCLMEAERILKKGGCLCISTDNPLSVYRRIKDSLDKMAKRETRVKEEYVSVARLRAMIPEDIQIYKIVQICPYPLLPRIGPLGWTVVGKAWVGLTEILRKIPFVGEQFCNKYVAFGVKR